MAVLLLAGAKILCGLGVWVGSTAWRSASPNLFFDWFYLLQLGAFCAASGLLIVGGWTDARARTLATILLPFGALFVDPLLRQATPLLPGNWSAFSTALYNLQPIVFSPAYFWQFAREFPRPLTEWNWRVSPRAPFRIYFAVGCMLIVANLAVPFSTPGTSLAVVSTRLSGRTEDGHLWEILMMLSLPAFGLILANVRASPEVERRRVRLFLAGIIAGVLPLMLDVLLAFLVPTYRDYSRAPHRIRHLAVSLSLALLLVPVMTVYAVLVDRVFDVHFFVRKALQYALARYTLLGLLAIPGIALVSYGYANRHRSIGDLLWIRPSVGWLLLIGTVLALTLVRRPLLELLDRRFFREEYDARRILIDLVDGSRRANTVKEQAALTVREIDRALHVATVSMLVRQSAQDLFVDPQQNLSSLRCDSQLAGLIGGAATPLDATVADSALGRLPASDLDWLNRARGRLFVPLLASDGSLLGLIAVGEKLSEAPFSAEDRELLTLVAASTALALEHRLLLESGPRSGILAQAEPDDDEPARQCSWCGVLQRPDQEKCQRCGGPVVPARLPPVLAGTFAIEREIGRGGMGVVYRGRDLKLDRPVALKTLPRLSVSSVNRLRQEALAMAAREDPHLAIIYGSETWRGSPVLILEYLAGGTLGDRLSMRPIAIDEVVSLGLAISNALDALHRSGLLHGDIKPSNIGYTAAGVPKLLDFGLARLVTGVSKILPAVGSSASTHMSGHGGPTSETATKLPETATQHVAGTAAYLSPEAIAMEPPGASFDLWSLAVTLFEALTGRNPFRGADAQETFFLIGLARLPEPQSVRADCPAVLASFFRSALSLRREERPASARAFHEALSKCR